MNSRPYFEAVIKVNRADDQEQRAQDIERGIGYSCALLMDEYGRTVDDIAFLLAEVLADLPVEESSD